MQVGASPQGGCDRRLGLDTEVDGDFNPGEDHCKELEQAHKLSVAMARSSAKAKRRRAKEHLNITRAKWEPISTMKVWKTMTNIEPDNGQPCRTPTSQGNQGKSSPDTRSVVEASLYNSMITRTTG